MLLQLDIFFYLEKNVYVLENTKPYINLLLKSLTYINSYTTGLFV